MPQRVSSQGSLVGCLFFLATSPYSFSSEHSVRRNCVVLSSREAFSPSFQGHFLKAESSSGRSRSSLNVLHAVDTTSALALLRG